MNAAELVYTEAAEARRSARLTERKEGLQHLASLIPHRHVGTGYCTSCGLPEGAAIHHWDER